MADFEKLSRMYFFLAIISFVLDIVAFFIVFGLLAGYKSDMPDLLTEELEDLYLTAACPYIGRIIVVMLYTGCDIVFLLWIFLFRSRLGDSERAYAHKALLGFGNDMRVACGSDPDKQSGSSAANANMRSAKLS